MLISFISSFMSDAWCDVMWRHENDFAFPIFPFIFCSHHVVSWCSMCYGKILNRIHIISLSMGARGGGSMKGNTAANIELNIQKSQKHKWMAKVAWMVEYLTYHLKGSERQKGLIPFWSFFFMKMVGSEKVDLLFAISSPSPAARRAPCDFLESAGICPRWGIRITKAYETP